MKMFRNSLTLGVFSGSWVSELMSLEAHCPWAPKHAVEDKPGLNSDKTFHCIPSAMYATRKLFLLGRKKRNQMSLMIQETAKAAAPGILYTGVRLGGQF